MPTTALNNVKIDLNFNRRLPIIAENDKGKPIVGSTGDRELNAHAVKDIKVGSFFTEPVYLDGRFVIAAPEMPFSGALARALLEWEFREVLSDGEAREEYIAAASSAPSTEGSEPAPSAVTAVGAAVRYVFGPRERDLARPAVAGLELDFRQIDEHGTSLPDRLSFGPMTNRRLSQARQPSPRKHARTSSHRAVL